MKNGSIYKENQFFVFTLIFISAFSFLLYLNATHGRFVYDDFKIIVENSFVKEWRYLPKIFTKDYFSLSGEMSYRPLVTISYFLDYAIWRLNPLGFHLTNVILHTGNSVLFYLFLRTILDNNKIVLFSIFFLCHTSSTCGNRKCRRLSGRSLIRNLSPCLSYLFYKIRYPSLSGNRQKESIYSLLCNFSCSISVRPFFKGNGHNPS